MMTAFVWGCVAGLAVGTTTVVVALWYYDTDYCDDYDEADSESEVTDE